jgi:hypothetical protein
MGLAKRTKSAIPVARPTAPAKPHASAKTPAPPKNVKKRQESTRSAKSNLPTQAILPTGPAFLSNWSSLHSYLFLSAVTILIFLPFSGGAFHVDDTLFLFAAKQIVKHPLDPYGFQLIWNTSAQRMSDITENPPLACYYSALVGTIAGWSERVLHFGFLLPALAVVLGTYRLARRCTRFPLLAALGVLLTPGFLVSANSVMCDTMMVALWVWAVILWVEGLEPFRPWHLLAASLLIAASALTKYYGLALIPLLTAHSLLRLRRIGWWLAFLLIPVLSVIGYELWTADLYGQGMISGAAEFAARQREIQQGSTLSHAVISLSFAGGCAITALTLAPLLWTRKKILAGAFFSAIAALALTFNWIDIGTRVGGTISAQSVRENWLVIAPQLTLCILSGVSILALAIAEARANRKNPESWLLALWVVGTLVFAGFVNWTVNARSVVPLIPAAGILIARRFDHTPYFFTKRRLAAGAAGGLALAGLLSFVVLRSDVNWANSAREAANQVYQQTRAERGTVYFMGHWGFQYYMEALGFTPADELNSEFAAGDMVIVPSNNIEYIGLPRGFNLESQTHLQFLPKTLVTTMSSALGAGFYSSYWGPLPFAFGKVPAEIYQLGHIVPMRRQ